MWGQHFCSCVPPNPTTSSILKLNSKSEYIYFNTLLFWNKYLLILQLCFHWIYSKKKINKYNESWIWTYYMYIYIEKSCLVICYVRTNYHMHEHRHFCVGFEKKKQEYWTPIHDFPSWVGRQAIWAASWKSEPTDHSGRRDTLLEGY